MGIWCYREGRGTRLTAWGPKGKKPKLNREQHTQEVRPNTYKRGPQETHPHETGSRHTHTCQPRRPPNKQPQTTSSMGAERRRSRGQTESKPHKRRGQTQTNAGHKRHTHTRQAPDTPRHVSQGDGRTGNRGQPQTTSAEGHERPRNGARPDTLVRTHKPDRPKDALPRHRATPSSRSAPEMKVAQERPGPPACTAWSARERSNDSAGPQGARTTQPTGAQRGGRKTHTGRPAPLQAPLQVPQPSQEAARLPRRRTRRLGG
jgi:hypothetical protein